MKSNMIGRMYLLILLEKLEATVKYIPFMSLTKFEVYNNLEFKKMLPTFHKDYFVFYYFDKKRVL